jgi:hypothetical protein
VIPRRLTQHLRDQNWFAAGIDFAIVVAGVFIGIQLANWKELRQFAAQEPSFLEQLRDELLENHGEVDLRERYDNQVVGAGLRR